MRNNSMKPDQRFVGIQQEIGWVVAILCLSLIMFIKFLPWPISASGDQEGFIWEAWLVLNGQIPYKDFFEQKPPIIILMNMVSLLWLGFQNFRWMPFFVACLANILFFIALRRLRILPVLAFLLVINFTYLLFLEPFHDHTLNDAETYGALFTVMAFSFLHWDARGESNKNLFMKFLGGVCVALALLSKEPFLLIVVPVIILNYIFEKQYNMPLRRKSLLFIITGIIAVMSLFFVYLLKTEALIPYLKVLFYSANYSKYYARDIGIFTQQSWVGAFNFDIAKLLSGYGYGKYLVSLVPFYLVFLWRWKMSSFSMMNISAVGFGLYAVTLGHCFWTHYYVIALVPLMLPAIYGAIDINLDRIREARYLAIILIIGIAVLLTYQVGADIKKCLRLVQHSDDMTTPANLRSAVERYTQKNDYILLMLNPRYYVLLDRRSSFMMSFMADEFIRMYPGVNEQDKWRGVSEGIEKKLPKIVYLENSYLLARQQKHLQHVLIPLLRKYAYVQISPGVYLLPLALEMQDKK